MFKSYLIIGGAGFIGVNTADYFLQKGQRVVIFDNLSRTGTEKNLEWLQNKYKNSSSLKFVRGDTRNSDDLIVLAGLMEDVDFILHLAAQVAVTTSVVDPRNDFENNILGTFNVLECLRQSNRRPALVYSSTNKVYGNLEDVPVVEDEKRYHFKSNKGISETQKLDFHSPYGCSKGAADQYVRDYSRIYALKTVVCRQSCIYGIHQFGIEDQGWVAWFIIAAILDKQITIYGNGKQVRDLLYVDDLVQLYDIIFDNIENLNNILGYPIDYKKGSVRPGDQPIYVSDISLLEGELGWKPKISVEQGIKDLWNWVKENKNLF
jgi:CDP-paratose 2-epimerase